MNHLNDEELALYVDGLKLRRTEDLPRGLLEHVEGCLQCKRAILEISALVPTEPYPQGEPHPFFDSIVKQKRPGWDPGMSFRVAAALVLLLAGAAAIYLLSPRWWTSNVKGNQIANHGPDSASTRSQHQGFGDAPGTPLAQRTSSPDPFLPSPVFESLAGQTVRSGGMEVLRPRLGDTIAGPQHFQWRGVAGDERFRIEILTNRGGRFLSSEVRGGSYTLRERLAPGLYYWKLEQKGELLYVGKFMVLSSPPEEHGTTPPRAQ
jgi:hypothetical protein